MPSQSACRRLLLTKSMFLKAVQCPRKVYYQNFPDRYPTVKNSLLQSLASGGEQVQQYARMKLYPNGIDMTQCEDFEESLQRTRKLILDSKDKEETLTLLEAPVCHENVMARIDVLQVEQDEIRVIEIKAKSWDSRVGVNAVGGKRTVVKKKYLSYIHDVAYQCLVIAKAFPEYKVTGWLQMPDRSKTCKRIGLNSLFPLDENNVIRIDPETLSKLEEEPSIMTLINVDPYVQHVLKESPLGFPGKPKESKEATMEEVIDIWQSKLTTERIPFSHEPPPIGSQCSSCEFRIDSDVERSGFHECWRLATGLEDRELERPVVDLWHSTSKKNFIDNNKFLLGDLNHDDLKYNETDESNKEYITRVQRQAYQACGIPAQDEMSGSLVLKTDYLREQMAKWRYPLHFVDFETAAPSLPFFPGMAAYETVAFQFSHHALHDDGTLEHKSQFLHTVPGKNPNFPFLEALANSLGSDNGTVLMFSPHESTVMKSLLAKHSNNKVSQLAQLLPGKSRAMVDLAKLAERGMFLQQAAGSISLKKILPPLLTMSAELKMLYSSPTYGTKEFSSHNFADMQWWQLESNDSGFCEDPYNLLSASQEEEEVVTNGIAAMAAYHTLQWNLLSPSEREGIERNLLRYCELDTLAMAMVVQAWKGWISEPNDKK